MTFAQIVSNRLDQLNLTPFAAEKAHGLPADAIRNVIKLSDAAAGKNPGPTLMKARQICDALGLEFYIGPPRKTPPLGFSESAAAMAMKPEGPATCDFVAIPYHARDLAHRDLSGLALSQDWIDAAQLDAHALTAVVMPSDDMAPMIGEGAVLLVDGRADPQPEPQLHAFAAQGRLRVGWLCLPRAGSLVAFFARSFSPPVIQKARGGTLIEPLGRIVGRFDDLPQLWIDATEKSRLLDTAKELTKPKKA